MQWSSILFLVSFLAPALAASAAPPGGILLSEGFEDNLELRAQIHGANQPYQAHEIGLSTEKAHGGTHCLKVDVTYKHGFDVYLAPRSNDTPQVEWGSIGGAGTFNLKPLGTPLDPARGYLLTAYVWVERATPQNPVQISVETVATSDYGAIRNYTRLDRFFAEATAGWVKVEQELTSSILEQMDAAGNKTEGLRLASLSLTSFANGQYRMTAYVDDVTLQELPAGALEEWRVRRRKERAANVPAFRRHPEIEDTFLWGVYGGLQEPGPGWLRPYRQGSQEDIRRQQAERIGEYSDWMLLDLRRHYADVCIQGGGMLFPTEGQAAYDYVKACLDKCAEYGVRFSPSTYLTQHYSPAPREKCQEAMKKATGMFASHPALLAYWLVDEPGSATAPDYYWGKREMETLDTSHPSLCTCNCIASIAEFAPTLPIVCIDYYPMGPLPACDKGPWAIADSVRYARRLGKGRIWVLNQVFGQSSWRAPSREEFLIQVFGSMAEGATGFAPYAHADQPSWHNPQAEYGRLMDPYGNPSPPWEEMKRVGPLLRSAGPLLAGARRLPDEAAVAQVSFPVVSPVGRKRPAALARAFADERRKARYLVVANNTTAYRLSLPVAVASVAPGEKLLDLFSLREVPLEGSVFTAFLKPGDGRLYGLAAPDALEAIRKEVRQRRCTIERDLLELEVRVGRRMGTDVAAVAAALAKADGLAGVGEHGKALEELADAAALLRKQSRANGAYQEVNGAIEETRHALGRVNGLMCRRIVYSERAFPRDDPQVTAMMEQMVALSDRFYALQSRFLRQGPRGLSSDAGQLLQEVETFAGRAGLFFGE